MKRLNVYSIPEMPFVEVLPEITIQLNSWGKDGQDFTSSGETLKLKKCKLDC